MEFIHIADVHLGVNETWRQEAVAINEGTTRAFMQVIERCRQEHIDILFVAGDLFHRPPSIRDLRFVIDRFNRLSETLVVLIAGNHDHIEAGSAWLQVTFPKHVIFFASEKVAMCELSKWRLRIYGSSFLQEIDDRRLPGSRLRLQEGFHHILVGHGGDSEHHPFVRDDLQKFTYVALGHLHQMKQLTPTAFYAGSPAAVYETEDWQHGYIRGSLDIDSGRLEAVFHPLSAVPEAEEEPVEAVKTKVEAEVVNRQPALTLLEEEFRRLCAELPIGRRTAVLELGLTALRRAEEEDEDAD
ncbi:MAG: DNA repair exonuclease [Eubacteriales bacterium]|nr:DNA repair exonuclease [Eubacteriales bacterium]